MTVAMRRNDAKEWFGVAPPDLSVIARSRGADWLYTYLRSFYRDDSAATGWNNLVFPNVGMPHVLWELQGQQALEVKEAARSARQARGQRRWCWPSLGRSRRGEYDRLVADLVNYLVFMGEPDARCARASSATWCSSYWVCCSFLFYLLKRSTGKTFTESRCARSHSYDDFVLGHHLPVQPTLPDRPVREGHGFPDHRRRLCSTSPKIWR